MVIPNTRYRMRAGAFPGQVMNGKRSRVLFVRSTQWAVPAKDC
ncbi:hypothetical protein RBWH47_00805 [Rhodopirellula baltica WH47]|uniref:Uncharacterized protein n=1 Tax=Rhodopirellula baltica WH47 TaxID=991778 RepID=F2AKD0_RHOBT|nr:hypothetical protein RBWH47_00805 [Rhodopirellula baltica WH47]